jgi:PUL domain
LRHTCYAVLYFALQCCNFVPIGAQFVEAVAEHCTPETPPTPAPLCGLRLLANLFKLRHTRSLALSTLSTQLDAAAEGTGTSSSGGVATPKTVRLAAATLLLNAAVAITQVCVLIQFPHTAMDAAAAAISSA